MEGQAQGLPLRKIDSKETYLKKLALLLSIVFAVAIALSITIPALAASSDTTTVSGSVQTTIEVYAPGTVSLGNLIPGTSTESINQNVTVRCNKAGWTLTVSDDRKHPVNKGHMEAGTIALANSLEVKGNGKPYAYLNTTWVTLVDKTGGVGITNISDVRFRQATDWADTIETYSFTVTFTATIL